MELLHQPEDIIAQRYRVVTILGQGGIGTTYEAEDLQSYKRVALKALSLSRITDWKVFELFEREARVLSHLNHPAIPKYLDHFQVDMQPNHCFYLVRALAPGKSLAALVESGWHAEEGEVKHLAIQILEILCYLHSLTPPVIHRDIKPQNIIRQADGKVFLVDFGAVQDTYRHTLTGGSTVVGTYGYMAPEQFRGQAVCATDLYGLGATLLFVLMHRSPAELPQCKLKIDFRSCIQISGQLADWLETMLEPAVEERFPSAKEALALLRSEKRLVNSSLVQISRHPAGSRIALIKTRKRLVINIPPAGLRMQNLLMLIAALIATGFIVVAVGTISTGSSLFFGLFFGLILFFFWLNALTTLKSALFDIAGRTLLEIDQQGFWLQWKFLGVSYQINGRTEDINRVEVRTVNSSLDQIFGPPRYTKPETACTVVEGARMHHFGQFLAQPEKEWLVEEIKTFLKKLTVQHENPD